MSAMLFRRKSGLADCHLIVTWPAGSPYVFQLEQPGPATGIISMDGKTRMSRVTPWPLQFLDLGSPLASNATGLRAAGPAIGTPPIALALTQNFFDVPRNIVVTSTGNDSGATITVTSKDAYGNPVTETFAGGNIGAANGKKAHFTNITVTLSAAAAANVSVGWGNVLGLPAYVPNAVHLIKELQDDAAAAAGTLVIGDQTSPQSGTTGDVRGTYVPNAAPDGTKAYGLLVAIPDPGYLGAVQYPAV